MPHRTATIAALVLVSAATWFALVSRHADRWPGGASPSGLTFGIAAAAIVLFEAAYALRRRFVNWRLGSRSVWRAAHIAFGMLSLPLIAMHAGFRTGGVFTTSLLVVYGLVVASGLGLWFASRRGAARSDIDHDRIDVLRKELAREVRELIEQTCGVVTSGEPHSTRSRHVAGDPVALSTERTASRIRGRVVEFHFQRTPSPGGEALLSFWSNVVKPFLEPAPAARSPLVESVSARREFAAIRIRLGSEFFRVVDRIEESCDRRRELLSAERKRAAIEFWMLAHTPLTVALVVLTIAHTRSAWRFR